MTERKIKSKGGVQMAGTMEDISVFAKNLVESIAYLGIAGLGFLIGGSIIIWIVSFFG